MGGDSDDSNERGPRGIKTGESTIPSWMGGAKPKSAQPESVPSFAERAVQASDVTWGGKGRELQTGKKEAEARRGVVSSYRVGNSAASVNSPIQPPAKRFPNQSTSSDSIPALSERTRCVTATEYIRAVEMRADHLRNEARKSEKVRSGMMSTQGIAIIKVKDIPVPPFREPGAFPMVLPAQRIQFSARISANVDVVKPITPSSSLNHLQITKPSLARVRNACSSYGNGSPQMCDQPVARALNGAIYRSNAPAQGFIPRVASPKGKENTNVPVTTSKRCVAPLPRRTTRISPDNYDEALAVEQGRELQSLFHSPPLIDSLPAQKRTGRTAVAAMQSSLATMEVINISSESEEEAVEEPVRKKRKVRESIGGFHQKETSRR